MSRLFIRVCAQSGSRTIITQDLTARDAGEIRHALVSKGFDAFIHDDIAPVDMKAILKRRKRADLKAVEKAAIPSNVTKLPVRKRKP